MDKIHKDNTLILKYNDEDSLFRFMISGYPAWKIYVVECKLPAGKESPNIFFIFSDFSG